MLQGLEGGGVSPIPPPPPVLSSGLQVVQDVSYWLILSVYATLTCVSILAIINFCRSQQSSPIFSRVIKCLLPFCTFFRCLDMGLNFDKDYMTQEIADQSVISILIGGLPGYLFISTYLLIALYWVTIYYKTVNDQGLVTTVVWMIYFAINFAIYSIWIWLILLMLVFPDQTQSVVHPLEGLYAAFLNIVSCTIVTYYGIRLRNNLKSAPIVSKRRLMTLRKIGILTGTLTVIYLIRAIDIILDIFVIHSPLASFLSKLVFLVICEIVPITLILFALSLPGDGKTVPLNTNYHEQYYVVRA